jgi:hypothetical protein
MGDWHAFVLQFELAADRYQRMRKETASSNHSEVAPVFSSAGCRLKFREVTGN